MPSEYSYVHRQPDYWKIRYDAPNGWEAEHIHAKQGDRELQVYTDSLAIKNQDGRFSYDEVEEIRDIARLYRNNYLLEIDTDDFSLPNNIDELNDLKNTILNNISKQKRI
ncbi:MAG: hypothetical protein RSB77_03985 [Bacilli bacterium]